MTTVELLYQMETDILINMIRLLKRGAIGSAMWQAEKLAQLGTLRAMNRASIQRNLMQAIEEARKEIENRALEGATKIDAFAKRENLKLVLPELADAKLKAVMDGWYIKTGAELNRMGATMLNSSLSIYTQTVETVTAEVLAGSLTGRQAVAKTSAQWASDGIKAFTDSAGRNWTTEAYAENLIRTTTRNARREAEFARMDDYDIDLILVSDHAGARPLCAPYQGMILSRYGRTPNVKRLDETSFGQPAGLFGINCGHTMTPWTDGMNKGKEEGETDTKENERIYKQAQEQRRLEREIRKEKRGLAIAQEQGSETTADVYKARIKEKQAKMREFIYETGRTRQYEREQIYK
jgi:hypothetical protein